MEPEVETTEQADELEQFEAEFSGTAEEPQPEDEPTGADQTVTDEGAEPEPTGAEPEQPAGPEADLYSIPDNAKFGEFRGKKMTAAQLEEAGLLKKLVTWEHQALHAQEVHERNNKLEDQIRQLEARMQELAAPKPEPTAEPPKELTPEETQRLVGGLVNRYLPAYEKAAKNGGVEEEMVDLYPRFVAVQEHRFQSGQAQLNLAFELLTTLAEDYATRHQTESTKTGADHIFGVLDNVASGTDVFAPFKEGELRDTFIKWFASEKNERGYDRFPVEMVNERIMEDALWAFMRGNPSLFEAAPEPTTSKRREKPGGNRHLATGGGSGTAGGGAPTMDKLSAFEQEFKDTSPQ